jgi:hypothetical protein
VPPGRERARLDLLDSGDGVALLSYVAELSRPPRLVSSDERRPGTLDSPQGPRPDRPPVRQELLASIIERHEQRWCEEPVPALDGYTPREAAADPTRRGDLMRLIDSFPEIDLTEEVVGLRPTRLRKLLNLSQD